MKIASLFLFYSWLLVSSAHPQSVNEKKPLYAYRHALVIGNANYEHWSPLPGVATDVEQVAEVLDQRFFNVKKVINADLKTLTDTITRFGKDFGYEEENCLLLYFAGHGYTDEAFSDKKNKVKYGYFVPTDAPAIKRNAKDFGKYALSTSDFETIVKGWRAKHIMLVFDSCFSGNLMEDGPKFDPIQFCNDMSKEPTRQFITAGSANQQVPDVSIFRKFFVDGLSGKADVNNDGLILGSELAAYLFYNVSTSSQNKQTPQYTKVKRKEYEGGDMIFTIGKVVAPDIFNRKCVSVSAEPDTKQTDTLLPTLQALHQKISEALRKGDKGVLGLYLGEAIIVGQCGEGNPMGKDYFIAYALYYLGNPRSILTKQSDFKAERVDKDNAKLELIETYTQSDGSTISAKIVAFYTVNAAGWKLRSYNRCAITN